MLITQLRFQSLNQMRMIPVMPRILLRSSSIFDFHCFLSSDRPQVVPALSC